MIARRAKLIAAVSLALATGALGRASASEAPSPQAYLAQAIAILKARHMNSPQANWPDIEAQARRLAQGATTPGDTYPAIRFVINQLHERHSRLVPAETAERITHDRDTKTGAPAPLVPPAGELRGRIAYVTIPSFLGSEERAIAYERAGRASVTALDGTRPCGWIIDLRDNSGGNMWPMVNTLGGLLGAPPFGFFVNNKGLKTRWTWENGEVAPESAEAGPALDAAPTLLSTRDAPLAILIGAHTASSGEFTAIALTGRASVRSFGQPTAGFTTANRVIQLSDGAQLLVSTGWGEDRTGHRYDAGLSPDETVGPTADAAVAARAWLTGQGCR